MHSRIAMGAHVHYCLLVHIRPYTRACIRTYTTAAHPPTAGHSLGGGVAALLTLLLHQPGNHNVGAGVVCYPSLGVKGAPGPGCSPLTSLPSLSPPPLHRVSGICLAYPPVLSAAMAESCSEYVLCLIHNTDMVACCSLRRCIASQVQVQG